MNKRDIFKLSNKTKVVLFWALCAFLLFPVHTRPLFSQSPGLSEASTLNDWLAYAALHNPGLEAAFHRWQAALERIPQANARPDPRLTFAYFIREVETRVGPQRAKLGLVQTFPWFGKLKLNGKAALEAAHAEKQQYERLKLDLFYRVKDAYYEYYYVNRAAAVLEENVKLLQFLAGVVETKYRTGQATHADLTRVQVEADKLRDWQESTADMVRPVGARLNLLLNRPADEPLPVPKNIRAEIPALSYERLQEWLKANNPSLKAVDHMAAREEFLVKLAKRNRFPDIAIGLDWIVTDPAVMPGTVDSGKDPLAAMMSLNVPINFKKNRAAVKEAQARLQAAAKERAEKENDLLAMVEMAFYRFRDAGRKVALYKDALIPRAEQALAVTRSAFEAGRADFMNLIDSQRTLLTFELAYERASASQYQHLAELEMLVGKELW